MSFTTDAIKQHTDEQEKENQGAASDPVVPDADDVLTLSDGTTVICSRDAKGRRVVPDEIMDKYYKELPDGTRDERGRIAKNGGMLNPLNSMPEAEALTIRQQGRDAQAAKQRQRQSIADTIDAMLRSKAGAEELEKYGLQEGATKQEALVSAMYREAIDKGTVRAFDSLRDTVGEQPVSRQQIEADIVTEADKMLMQRIEKRLGLKG